MYQIGKSAAIFLKHRMAKGKAAAMAGMAKAKTATKAGLAKGKAISAKGLSKGKVLAKKAGDAGVILGGGAMSLAKQLPKDAVKEFRGVKRAVKRTAKKFPDTFMKYPLTTGAVAGLGIQAALPKKEKKKNNRNYG